MREADRKYIKRCFELARRATGYVSPNPMVGAVLVKEGRVIGEGYHQKYGEAHAEVEAIQNADSSLENSTLYCSLEPCCHTGKQTPPCVDLIIKSKIKRVVISNIDPNPLVLGKGLDKLRQAGIEVEHGILENDGKKLNEVFFKSMETSRPFVHLKLAQTLDGKISTMAGDSKWISDSAARETVHQLRKAYDAVCIGRKTAEADDPELTIRMGVENKGKVPYRIVVGNINKIDLTLRLFNDKYKMRTIIATKFSDLRVFKGSLEGLNVLSIRSNNGKIDIDDFYSQLIKMKISSLLVEGGAYLISSLLKENKFDKLSLYICPKLIGNGPSYYVDDDALKMSEAMNFSDVSYKIINDQVVVELYPINKTLGR